MALRQFMRRVQPGVPVMILLAFFGILFGNLLSSHMLFRKADGLYSGGSTWGDLAWHLSMLSNFAERGWSAVRENPIFPGTRLSYPFLPDLLSAWLVRCGTSLQASLILPTFVALLGSVAAIYFLARSVIGATLEALIVPLLFFFNGSIVGCYYLWRDYRNASFFGAPAFFNNLPHDYSHLIEHNLQFSNIVSDYMLPQRASVFGLGLGILVVQLLWLYWEHSKAQHLFYAGLVLSLMPLVHFHSFVALVIVGGFLLFIQLFGDPQHWKRSFLSWFWFAIPLLVIALPQAVWISPTHVRNFFRIQLGWMTKNDPFWLFWLKNLSPHLFIFVFAYFLAKPKLRTFYLAFAGLFALSNVVVFQPHDFDNMKLMLWWFLVSCVLAGSLFHELRRRYSSRGFAVALALTATLIATGTLSVYRELHVSWLMFSSEDVALASFVQEHSGKDAVFLTSDKHNNAIACLAGRRILMGYRGWLWTHGIDYQSREHDIFEMYSGSGNAADLMRQYGVKYVLVEGNKRRDFHENVAAFLTRFPLVYQSPNYMLFKVSD
jgi:hypothetical protein